MRVLCISSVKWSSQLTGLDESIVELINMYKPVEGETYTVIDSTPDGYYQLAEIQQLVLGRTLGWYKGSFKPIDGIDNGRPVESNHKPSSIVPNCPPVIVGVPGT